MTNRSLLSQNSFLPREVPRSCGIERLSAVAMLIVPVSGLHFSVTDDVPVGVAG